MNILVILNPYAQRWNALKRKPEVEDQLNERGVDFEIIQTEYPGHGIELAAKARIDGYDTVVAAGGDSTINEVVNGVLRDKIQTVQIPSVGVLPLGTANDFADNLGIPKDIKQAVRVISSGFKKQIDVCMINDRYFVNNSGVGLEPTITTIQMKITRVHGILRYLIAALRGIYQNPSWETAIEWESGNYRGPATLVSVGNSPRTGGLFYLTPNANPFDGKLTFLVGSAKSRWELLQLLPKAMRAGENNVASDPRVFEHHCKWIRIELETASPIHADGEVFNLSATKLEYSIFPGLLPILLPSEKYQ